MKTPFDPHATNLRTAAESGPRTLWMAADRIDDLSAKLATATAELEKAKGREADMRRKSIAETVEWAASTVDKLARESLSADGSEYLDDIGPALESAAETIRQKAGPT